MTSTASALYGDSLADVYDTIYPATSAADHCGEFVGALTPPGGRILEFGVGTGRVAQGLVDRGFELWGVDASQEMLDRYAQKLGERANPVLGDFTEVQCPGTFDTVLIALNTLFMVPSQDGQMAVLRNAHRHLRPGGRLVVEVYDPTTLHSLPEARDTMLQHLSPKEMLLCSMQVDRVNQRAMITQVIMRDGEFRQVPELSRYAWPAELDLMARVSGFSLEQRFEDWQRRSFEHRSRGHISVYAPSGTEPISL